MQIHKGQQTQGVEYTDAHEPDFVLVQDYRPPPRIELARERMLMCRLYLGLIRSMTEDYGAAFAAHNDSATFRTIGIYVFLRTVMLARERRQNSACSKTATRCGRTSTTGNGETRLR